MLNSDKSRFFVPKKINEFIWERPALSIGSIVLLCLSEERNQDIENLRVYTLKLIGYSAAFPLILK